MKNLHSDIDNNVYKVKRHTLNLDDSPSIRWNNIIDEYKDYFPLILAEIDTILDSLGTITKNVVLGTVSTYEKINMLMYREELKSISDRASISLSKLILMQLCYEMFSACTSTGFKFNGKNVHYRTMDWDMPNLKHTTIEVEFKKHGKTLFIAPTFVGYVGVFTGVAENLYSVALNYRRSKGTLLGNVMKALSMVWPVGYLLRHSLEQGYNINQLIKIMSETELISPCYITIVSPKNDTTVLVRDPKSLVEKRTNNECLIQTNNDSVSNYNILYSNERIEAAKNIISNLKCNSYYDILKAFFIFPIINEETVYVSIMDPKTGFVNTFIPKNN